ncbi:nucleotidyltransferase domain-containing protein [Rhizobium sp. 11515TR]|uniref:nucleotidyltransferase domain-containing protein n=1 Tax=Rhizobium sp. 11515TR TaxID=2028343 RepID=UPI000BA886D0|nr:nucleotidyltransferase domain-containing protein [Rhizobium sp. 11515TR]ASW06413.1 DNA polymerase subunit beta [Rhizobium sp. 11515TR]
MSTIDFMLSRRQQRMLAALLLHPDRQYGSNELIRIGGPGYGAGRRVLQRLEEAGIVMKSSRGNQRLYIANCRHPIFPELRSICVKTFGVADVIAKQLAGFGERISLAFLFGSVAQGTDRADSDIDLMIVGSIDVFELGGAIQRIQELVGRTVDLNLYTNDEWTALRKDRVISAILAREKIMVIGPSG